MTPEDVVLDARSIHKRYGHAAAVAGVSLAVRSGEVVCIIGPSGSGKSTFLRCLNLLEEFDRGCVYLNGRPLGYHRDGGRLVRDPESVTARARADIGMVFQQFNLFPNMTVMENLCLAPVLVRGYSRAKAAATAQELLESVGMADRSRAYPSQLSGGQQQRVAIARALAMHPLLMLFDEPTSALDPELVGDVLDVMRKLATSGMTMIVVTHEIGFARELADRVVFMETGIIVEQGPAQQVLSNPTQARTAEFLSKVL